MFTDELMFWSFIPLKFRLVADFPAPEVVTGNLVKHTISLSKLVDFSGLNIVGRRLDIAFHLF